MRILVAGIIGGIIVFVWGAVAHMALPIGEAGFRHPAQQDAVLGALSQSAQGDGVYMYPSMEFEKYGDPVARESFIAQNASKPYALVIYRPGGNPSIRSMAPSLVKQFASVFLAALLAAWILASAPPGFGRRVAVSAALGLFAWLAVNVPYWNWYLFPLDLTLAALAEQVIGWLLGGVGIAWWLGRGRRSPA
ncbi:hypothetical protein [Luteimonas aquatica]|uniref:hypothetical protein n=1 Tax=Luteimonas aquatica TaxID=450364 RepID=UPI001F57B058|nr:hypothetical protein [Luteimonas aquatica]